MSNRIHADVTCLCGEYERLHGADWLDFECSCCGGCVVMETNDMVQDVKR
jgi:hypothetical protein